MSIHDVAKKMFSILLPSILQTAIKKRYYLRIVRTISESDQKCFSIIKHLIALGNHVLDIGANIGTYTIFLSNQVGANGRVYSIEPVPETCDILRFCMKKLHMAHVNVLQYAASDREDKVQMVIPRYPSGVENIYRSRIIQGSLSCSTRSLMVSARTIDSLLAEEAGPLTFVIIDVEGHELAVVRGGLSIFRKFHPALLIEVTKDPDDPQSESFELFQLLRELGYNPYCMEGTFVRPRCPGDKYLDYFFLTAKHTHMLQSRAVYKNNSMT